MEDHGTIYATRFKRMREQVEAMREIWTAAKPEYHGEIVDFPPMMTWPKPKQQPLPIIVGGAFPHAARRAVRYGNGWIPIAGRANYGNFAEYFPVYKKMLAEAGRSLAEAPITMFGAAENYDQLIAYRELGVARVVAGLPPENSDKILPVLDRWAELIRKINS
jgi:alkanesulfonate monooxygenase SsuD/methylene tetrahydromethanopterin reductase-like flavin-dependent oxidoreductase (luciferase family)